jgi:phytoene dehydrogenase-like protein
MMKKRITIIGGGVAGLSAGIYSAMNGFDTEILEMHTVAGGQCTAWDRKGYRFDYCLHWLLGTSTGAFHSIWKETNVLNDETVIIDHEIHSKIVDQERNEFVIYADIDRWEEYLVAMAPEDVRAIKRMCRDMRKSALLQPFVDPPGLRRITDYIKVGLVMLPIFNLVRKFGRLTCEEYFDKLGFKNERLVSVLNAMYGMRNFSALAFIFMLAWYHQKNAGYIKGGSYPLAQRMVERFTSFGGTISYGKRVRSIIVEDHQAKGVVLTDGTRIFSDYVLSAADGYSTIYKMLEGKYVSKKIEHAYSHWDLFTPLVQVSFGIKGLIKSDAPVLINITGNRKIGSTRLDYGFSLMNYSYDDTMAPEGKTTIVMRFDSPWKLWENLEGDAYLLEKEQIRRDAIKFLEEEIPGIAELIEVVDIATPRTGVRFTGVKDGAYEGFMPTKENMMKSLDMTLPGLKNFYMAGQWLFPGGGLPPSAQTGKWAIQLICKKERHKFIQSKQQ